MSKRPSPDADDSLPDDGRGSPVGKRQRLVTFEPVRLPAISTLADLDLSTLQLQNKKLGEKIKQRQRKENDLNRCVERLELRQTQVDAVLCIVNRHWNRLDEDVRILLQRFDAETAVESETENESSATSAFLLQLAQWDKSEIDDDLMRRVEFSRRATAKLVQAFDRVLQRNERLTDMLKDARGGEDAEGARPESDQGVDKSVLSEHVVSLNSELQEENKKLQLLLTKLQSKNSSLSMKLSEMSDKLSAAETQVEESQNKLAESDFELQKSQNEVVKLDCRLAESVHQLRTAQAGGCAPRSSGNHGPSAATAGEDSNNSLDPRDRSKSDEYQVELDDVKELATSRLAELHELTSSHKEVLRELDSLKMNLNHLPSDVIKRTVDYQCLQSQFSVLYHESIQIRAQLEETRLQLSSTKTEHLKQIEQMESEELQAQKQLRAEMIQLEDHLSQVRREYEMLRVEFEQNLAANEQSGPFNKETRQMLMSCKAQNQQLKIEMGRYKKKWKDACSIIAKSQKELDDERKHKENLITIDPTEVKDTPASPTDDIIPVDILGVNKSGETESDVGDPKEDTKNAMENRIKQLLGLNRDLKAKSEALDRLDSDKRERAEILTSERRARDDCDRLKTHILRIMEQQRDPKQRMLCDELQRRGRKLEEQLEQLRKEISSCKQEEDVLLNEMEVTGQAYEDMQEQNLRLIQQLREKDDANFRLMSERIRSNQQQKMLKEGKELIEEQVIALQNQVAAQNLVVRNLEEKERLLQNNLATVEKELNLRQQALELHKRKALESAQSSFDLKLQLEKLQSQLTEAQATVTLKTSSLEEESFKIRRSVEEISGLKKKVERAKKMEKAGTADEVLLEEIRELKEALTCPSCKVNRKDGILTKCFHVFCFDCLKNRYEGRRRKCPKCNHAFGANDFRRIYIG